MKTKLHLFLLIVTLSLVVSARAATTIHSVYIGPFAGDWSDPANWRPAIVPNNGGDQVFDVRVGRTLPGVIGNIDIVIDQLKLTKENLPTVLLIDHDFRSTRTSLGVDFPQGLTALVGGVFYPQAFHKSVHGDLGDLADFSGTTLHTGNIFIDASAADPGISATLQFNGADIHQTQTELGFGGAESFLLDEQGHDALAHFDHILLAGILDIETGHHFISEGDLVNEGSLFVFSTGFFGPDAPATVTVSGDYTDVGFPLDPDTDGNTELVAPGPTSDATLVVNGRLTNYDPASNTLHKARFSWGAASGRSATTRVLGTPGFFDIRTSEASLVLFGPKTGLRDGAGRDALRNLSTSSRLLLGDRDFTSKGDFTSTSRLSIFGDTQMTVRGNLTIEGGFLELRSLTGYAFGGDPAFPLDPAYANANLLVKKAFSLPSGSILRFHIFDTNTLATLTVRGTATIAGSLQTSVDDISAIAPNDSFTVATAKQLSGQFSNVASGQRVDTFVGFNPDNSPIGAPIGSFLVTYDNKKLVLSDFQPANGPSLSESRKPAIHRSRLDRRSSLDRGDE